MNRTNSLIAGIIVLVLLGGILTWVILTRATDPANSTQQPQQSAQEDPGSKETPENTASVTIKDFAFSPQIIKVKKGTTVTWTNQDNVGHNVIANDANNTGGLPTDAPLLAKGQSYSFTFEQTGTFEYRCSPHPQMTATVEVTE